MSLGWVNLDVCTWVAFKLFVCGVAKSCTFTELTTPFPVAAEKMHRPQFLNLKKPNFQALNKTRFYLITKKLKSNNEWGLVRMETSQILTDATQIPVFSLALPQKNVHEEMKKIRLLHFWAKKCFNEDWKTFRSPSIQ